MKGEFVMVVSKVGNKWQAGNASSEFLKQCAQWAFSFFVCVGVRLSMDYEIYDRTRRY